MWTNNYITGTVPIICTIIRIMTTVIIITIIIIIIYILENNQHGTPPAKSISFSTI